MFYTYNQNNSGGVFKTNKHLKHFVIIEANSAEEANEKAEDLGIYFNGVEKGIDCPCCGNRWYEVEDWQAEKEPLIFGKIPEDFVAEDDYFGYEVVIYYQNGTKEIVKKEQNKQEDK